MYHPIRIAHAGTADVSYAICRDFASTTCSQFALIYLQIQRREVQSSVHFTILVLSFQLSMNVLANDISIFSNPLIAFATRLQYKA